MILKEKSKCRKCGKMVDRFNFNRTPMVIQRCPYCDTKIEGETRDAAVNDLYLAGSEQGNFCDICRFKDNGCDERKVTEMYCWEWRGVQEVE